MNAWLNDQFETTDFTFNNPVECLFGSQHTTTASVPQEERDAASAWRFVDVNDPPIYMVSGDADFLAYPQYNADLLEQTYANLGAGYNGSAWNDVVEGGGHDAGRLGANAAAINLFLSKVANGDWD